MTENPPSLDIGSPVLLDGLIQATITAIMVRAHNSVSYEVLWWNERIRCVEWVEAWEVQPDTAEGRTSQVL